MRAPSGENENRGSGRGFYEARDQGDLRLGDVLSGVVASGLALNEFALPRSLSEYTIEIRVPDYSALLTPCCNMRDGFFTFAPLIPVRSSFFQNPYFDADLTRLNRQMEPQESVSPSIWDNLPANEKARRLSDGRTYAFLELFVYGEAALLQEYEVNVRGLGKVVTRHYMVDFRHMYRLNAERIKKNAEEILLARKVLQLTAAARSDLREKIGYYFGRPAEEDLLELG